MAFDPSPELVPVGSDHFTAVECRAATLDLARPRLIDVIMLRAVQALQQPCGNLRPFVIRQVERGGKEPFSVTRHYSSLTNLQVLSERAEGAD